MQNKWLLFAAAAIFILFIAGGYYIYSLKSANEKVQSELNAVQLSQSSTTQAITDLQEQNSNMEAQNEKMIQSLDSEVQDTTISSTLLNETMSRIVLVKCQTDSEIVTGTGDIQGSASGNWYVFTDLHVLAPTAEQRYCTISLPHPPTYTADETYSVTISKVGGEYPSVDFAELQPVNPAESFQQYPLPACTPNQVNIGDKVTVFGYPADGGVSLTVTDGIVSGIINTNFGYVYKTSAKIDEGNSGGLALDDNSQCGIGMPTWAISGAFEGLGYIQSWNMIINSGALN